MKRVRGFGFVEYGDVVEEYDEDGLDRLEYGFGSERLYSSIQVADYTCPRCNQKLFEADISLHGVIYIKCPKCKKEVPVITHPIVKPVGFRI